MPIHLNTGLPGHGKTLYTIKYVKELAERENRAVYYHGITDLTLSWHPLENPRLWFELPEGSIIVIDECQDLFPVHETKLSALEYVLQLAKHRHRGYDIFLISQHPMNIHAFVRRLTDKHSHIIRAFGMQQANVRTWNKVVDYPEKNKKDSQSSVFKYDKEVFTYYKSAEVHTIKRKIPTRVKLLLLIPLLLAGLGYYAYSILNPKHQRERITHQKEGDNPYVTGQKPVQELTYIEAHKPVLDDFAFTAPVYKEVTKPKSAPYPAACIEMGEKCKCYTQQGTFLKVTKSVCEQIVKNGFFVEWQEAQDAQNQPTTNHEGLLRGEPLNGGSMALSGSTTGLSSRKSPNNS